MSPRYTVGIDLGTSNTVVAYADHMAANGVAPVIHLLPIRQMVGPGETSERPYLPSARYHPAETELGGALTAPQTDGIHAVLGSYAQQLGAQVPGRLVTSAKSWLSHPGVDRHAAILPWGAPEGVDKVSPVDASASYLAHILASWQQHCPDAPLCDQDVVLTVPASFDEGARQLTLEAARRAGLPQVRLIEEPQAAFYDWLYRERQRLHTALAPIRRILVCDIGGGTTDLTLIDVTPAEGAPELHRVAVGEHLMLGGDNMDLALAHLMERRLSPHAPLSATQLAQLVLRCRRAKEQLLAAHAPDQVTVTLLGSGSKLIGAASSAPLTRAEVQQLVLDGFVPSCPLDTPVRKRRAGIVEFGLPYPADPAITHHLAAFLAMHAHTTNTAGLPDAVLFNGGVFHAQAITQRLQSTLSEWLGKPIAALYNASPDAAVAQGAVAYALIRKQRVPELTQGVGGGSPRTYALVLHDTPKRFEGICVLPRRTLEDTEVTLADRTFALRLGQPVRFHLVSSVADTVWAAGELMALDPERFVRLPAITTSLPLPPGQRPTDVQVHLSATLTEVGTLEVHCTQIDQPTQRWQLAFDLRNPATGSSEPANAPAATTHPRLPQAVALIDDIFGTQAKTIEPKAVRQLRARLESLLGPREQWDLPLLRTLYDALWARNKRRRRTPDHERAWLNMAGFCLRPGTGAPLDEWRIEQLWSVYEQGLQYRDDTNHWSEWWTLWRRASGGLNSAQQLTLLETVGEHLTSLQHAPRSKNPIHTSYDDMIRLAASLERVPAPYRAEVGEWLVQRAQTRVDKTHTWWAIGRMGARISLYGNAENVVPPETAAQWLSALLASDWRHNEQAAFTAATLARLSGDRHRDLPLPLREEVIARLRAANAPETWIEMIQHVRALDEADQKRSFGEALPPGLRLLAS